MIKKKKSRQDKLPKLQQHMIDTLFFIKKVKYNFERKLMGV